MDRFSYLGMSGAVETLQAQRVKMNNLANIHTPGFRADFSQIKNQAIEGDGFNSRVYAVAGSQGSNLSMGSIQSTGNELDIALSEGGWMAVQNAAGEERYTRRGDLTLDMEGFLVNGAGVRIMGEGNAINIPTAQKIDIGEDGLISVVPLGGAPGTSLALEKIKTIQPTKPEDLYKTEDGLFALKPGAELQESQVQVRVGFLEGSNVNAVLELIDMLQLAKHHDLNIKLIEAAEQNDQRSAQIMRFG